MTTGLKGQFQQLGNTKKLALLWGVAILVLLFAGITYQQAKKSSYARLLPLGVTIDLRYQPTEKSLNSLMLEYDYGYGFTAAHSQQQAIDISASSQSIHFSVSSWKSIRRMRLSASHLEGLQVRSVTLDRRGELVRLLVSQPNSKPLLQINDAAQLFSASLRGEG